MLSKIRTDKSILSKWWWSIDRLTLLAILILSIIGIVLVAAASPAVAERIGLNSFYFIHRHVIFLIPTIFIMIAVSFLNRKMLWRLSSLIVIGCLFLMAIVLFTGAEIKGATRWVSLFGFSLQPSEFMKPAFAISSAWLMARHQYDKNFPGQQAALGLYIVTLSLLLLEPDVGMSFVVSCIWGVQVFLSGLPIYIIILLIGLGMLGFAGAYMIFPHVSSRVDRFLDPAVGDTYQVQKSLDAFSHGGLLGTGPGQGQIKMNLPDAHADFIFAVAGEEFGMLFAIVIIIIFSFIIVRSAMRIFKSQDMFVLLGATGLLVQFSLQSLIHMGSSLQLLPAKGMTLPFISYGGSSLISFGFAMGALLTLTSKNMSNELSVKNRKRSKK